MVVRVRVCEGARARVDHRDWGGDWRLGFGGEEGNAGGEPANGQQGVPARPKKVKGAREGGRSEPV